jgi:glycosyltransferase involved in cell wall biosynthesis
MAAFIVAQGAQSLVASQGGRLVGELEKGGARHFSLPLKRRNPFTIFYSAFKLGRIIRREKVSLVHARSRAPAWAAYLACRWTGVPFVTTFHGTHRLQNRFKRYYNSIMVRGRRVIAISEFIKDHIVSNYAVDEAVIDVAPRGYDPAVFDPDAVDMRRVKEIRETLLLKEDVPVISLPGRLTRWKGQGLFLEALAKIKDLPWQALLIGGADKKNAYLEELKTVAEHFGIADRVLFVGDQPDIGPYYLVSDLVISASTEPEAFGRVAVEAQAMGRPVIASAHGGSLETVVDGETGWLFRNRNAADLAAALRKVLLGKIDLQAVGDCGRRWVAANYTIDRMCRAEWSSYEEVLGLKSENE